MKKEKELEKDVIELNILDSRIKELEQSLTLLEKQIAELQSCQLSLDELKNMKKNTKMLSSISPGVFVESNLTDNSKVIIEVGAKVFCKKTIDDAKKIIQKKINQVSDVYDKLIKEIDKLVHEIRKLEEKIKEKQFKT